MGERKIRRYALRIALVAFLLFVPGCGYSIHPQSSLPAKEVQIAPVVNNTREPKLQDKLSRALTEEFLKQGVRVDPAARYTLAVSINSFDMVSMSEKGGVAVDYRVVVNVAFRVLDSNGKAVKTGNIGSPFIVSVNSAENLAALLAAKEVAEEEAMRDIAMEIAGALLYR
ncbi:MAG: LptE family protein [Nitrospiraceae bacterium]|nr:LptE family protein [Nitrospiraceae bacterium]